MRYFLRRYCFQKVFFLGGIFPAGVFLDFFSSLTRCGKLIIDLSMVSIKIPQIGIYPVYYNSNNQPFPPIFIGGILNYKNVAIFRDIFVNIIAF